MAIRRCDCPYFEKCGLLKQFLHIDYKRNYKKGIENKDCYFYNEFYKKSKENMRVGDSLC